MEETEVNQSEESDSSSTIEETSSQEVSTEAEAQQAAPELTPEEKLPPFHEHPRFKEVIEQNRGYKDQLSQYQGALERLQQQMETLRQQAVPKKEEPKDPFLADLEKVNPAYAKSLQSVYEQAGRTAKLEQRLQQYEQQQFAEKAVGHFNNLLESNKISDPIDRKLYERSVRAEVYEREARGEKLGIKDLEKIFTEFHNEYSKAMEERSRKLTASYVQEKTKDKAPKGATGGVPSTSNSKKLAANDFSGQAKWLANQIRDMKKEH